MRQQLLRSRSVAMILIDNPSPMLNMPGAINRAQRRLNMQVRLRSLALTCQQLPPSWASFTDLVELDVEANFDADVDQACSCLLHVLLSLMSL